MWSEVRWDRKKCRKDRCRRRFWRRRTSWWMIRPPTTWYRGVKVGTRLWCGSMRNLPRICFPITSSTTTSQALFASLTPTYVPSPSLLSFSLFSSLPFLIAHFPLIYSPPLFEIYILVNVDKLTFLISRRLIHCRNASIAWFAKIIEGIEDLELMNFQVMRRLCHLS